MSGKQCVNLVFRPTSRPGHQYLVITTEGADILPHLVRACLERRVESEKPLVFGYEGTAAVTLYEPTPVPWDEMTERIKEILSAEYQGVTVNLPQATVSAGTA